MLDQLRKNQKSVVIQTAMGLIVLVFVFWGVGTMQANKMEIAAKVNGEIITRRQFDRAYQNLSNLYRGMAQQSPLPDEFLRSQAITQLVTTELLLQEADRLGLTVDASELRDAIAALPNFQNNGVFDRDVYVEVLRQNGFKPADFEELQRRQMLASKVQNVIANGVHVSPQEVADRFRYDNERVTLNFVRLPASRFVPEATFTDEELTAFYNDNQERYREPERVRIQLVEFRPQDFTGEVTPSDEEITAFYEANQAQFSAPEEVQASHILFRLAPDASDEDKAATRARAEAVLKQAKDGGDFAALAREHSQDSTAENGGDLGRFGRGVMTPPFEAAAFALNAGEVSDLVETQFGLHIIKLTEKFPARQEPLEAVRDQIIETLKTQQARKVALERVEAAHEELLDGMPLEKVAADLKLTVQSPEPFARNEQVGAIGAAKELIDEAFRTEAGEIGEIVTGPNGYVVLKVVERIPSAVPPLAEVRGRVESDLRLQKAAALAKQRAEALLATLQASKDLAALAEQEGLPLEEAAQIGRVGTYVPNLGNAPALKEAAFALTPEAPVAPAVYEVNGDAILAVLAERVPADESRLASEQEALTERLRAQAEAAAVTAFLDELKAKADIEYGQAIGVVPPAAPGAAS